MDTIIKPIHKRRYPPSEGVKLIDSDWDSLLVLDACRADTFQTVASLDRFDEYQTVTSMGERTDEWAFHNFKNERLGDLVYVSATPQISRVTPESFHDLIEAWEDGFDPQKKSVMPGPIVDTAKSAHEQYPNKRLLVHFMQPHIPFVADESKIFRDWWNPQSGVENWEEIKNRDRPRHVWDAIRQGVVSSDEAIRAYEENLEFVLEPALELATWLPGKTVITSDHGNLFGERVGAFKQYGHPRGVRHPALLRVPWAEIQSGDRPRIVDDGVDSQTQVEEDKINKRLQQLGYVDK